MQKGNYPQILQANRHIFLLFLKGGPQFLEILEMAKEINCLQ
jgi:hypothetical protein